MESRITKNRANMESRVMQDSGGKKPEEGKGVAPSKRPVPRWCPRGITKIQRRILQKMHQTELAEKKEEEEWDYWFNRLWPMTKPEQTWPEKRLAKEEGSSDDSGEEASKVTPTRGEDNPGSGDGTQNRVTITRSRETATQNWVTTTRTQVTATRVRRMTSKERSQF
jgi:hypothetical protein